MTTSVEYPSHLETRHEIKMYTHYPPLNSMFLAYKPNTG